MKVTSRTLSVEVAKQVGFLKEDQNPYHQKIRKDKLPAFHFEIPR